MRFVIDDRIVLSRSPEGPIARHLTPFAKALAQRGYALTSIRRSILLAACFSRWLKQKGIFVSRRIKSEHPSRYLQYRARQVQPARGDVAALEHLIEFLRGTGAVPAEKVSLPAATPAERCARTYEDYLREARGLARATIINYVPFVRSFLKDCFGNGPLAFSKLNAGSVVKFVRRHAPSLHPKRAKLLTSALRSFLRFLNYRGRTSLDLAAAVPPVANWTRSSIPRAISSSQVRQLLGSIDRRSAVGCRDYAIVLLLARLGLRSGEVASLELDDIDWNNGDLSVHGKGGQRSKLPLSAEVGKAIADYLRRGRPQCSSRRVFLRARAPRRGFLGASGIGSIVRHRLQRAGIDAPTFGTHQFRHGLATAMLRKGASLSEIGDLLGHQSIETTKIYTKIDLDALRKLALPWPGGAQ